MSIFASAKGNDSQNGDHHSNDSRKCRNVDDDTTSSTETNTTEKGFWEYGASDWNIDYSYLDDLEYKQRWIPKIRAITNNNKLSSTLVISNDESTAAGDEATPPSSSRSSSVSTSTNSTPAAAAVAAPVKGGGRSRGRLQKRTKNPLHGLSAPYPKPGSSFLENWKENRKYLLALIQYDEADQDWV
jgi:hypothetical protein